MFRYASITRSIDDGNQLVMNFTFNYRSNAGTELSSVSEYANCNYAQIRNSLGKNWNENLEESKTNMLHICIKRTVNFEGVYIIQNEMNCHGKSIHGLH